MPIRFISAMMEAGEGCREFTRDSKGADGDDDDVHMDDGDLSLMRHEVDSIVGQVVRASCGVGSRTLSQRKVP